ncbi:tetratricopeptide repeat protein 28-like [Orbicella faveolata]|uniref:tetratricopeptide repeat protein 28-like n=1 Tax=Orbicella faveolata TaxID=48498 RepID=UPI0009E26F1C|nr:tetratricopeptide repeat protein 28-like [Orbicella faveolata]
MANEYNKKAFAIFKDTGNRHGLASFYCNQGDVELAVGSSNKAKEYYENTLVISKEIAERETEVNGYLSLGRFFFVQSKYDRAEEYIKEALNLSEKIGDTEGQFHSLTEIAYIRMKEGKIQEAISYFLSGIEKWEELRSSLCDNDQFKISFSDRHILSQRDLGMLLCEIGNPTEALYVSELSRARALADLMSAQYSLENKISINRRTWAGLEGIVAKECNCTCLYVSYFCCRIYLWILKAGRVAHFQEIKGNDLISREGLSQHLDEFFNFRSFGVLPEELCEDRSLHSFQPESKTSEEDNHEVSRFGNESKASQGPKMNLPICYKLIIAPVAALLKGPEIIIVPDRALYQIPFAALTDESGKYLLESFRIRIVPSLTTLKLIDESPADYHCQTGALIVGNPDVGEVHFKGWLTKISRLPCAENEARIVGEKLGVEPLLGRQATKKAVLQAMKSVALIHIAAHGDAERGEIALAPSFRIPNGIPQEGLYLLTMTDISRIQLRAKLVVLSCCHSARGQTKAEGAVGIARAFLGSGARSVLVALWALDDKSTEELMTHFYDHLVAGQSAGESLHEAMKWMGSNGYDVSQWAPFILIGDNVTFDFGKKGKIR